MEMEPEQMNEEQIEQAQALFETVVDSLIMEDEDLTPEARLALLKEEQPGLWGDASQEDFDGLLDAILADERVCEIIESQKALLEGPITLTCCCGHEVTEKAEAPGATVEDVDYEANEQEDDEAEEADAVEDANNEMEAHFLEVLRTCKADDVHVALLKADQFQGTVKCPVEGCEDRNPEVTGAFAMLEHWRNSNEECHKDFLSELSFVLTCLQGGSNALLPEDLQKQLIEEDSIKLRVILNYTEGLDLDAYMEGQEEEEEMEDEEGDVLSPEFVEFMKAQGIENFDFNQMIEEQPEVEEIEE